MPIHITRSQMQDCNRCERKFRYRHEDEVEPTFPMGTIAMRLGTLGHYGLQAGYEWMKAEQSAGNISCHTKDGVESQFIDVALEAMAKLITAGTYLYRDQEQQLGLDPEAHKDEIRSIGDSVQYYVRQQIWDDFNRYKILATEIPFEYPYFTHNGENVVFSGVFDVLMQDMSHTRNVAVVKDHKFLGDVKSAAASMPLNIQMLSYESLCWRELGSINSNGGYDDVEVIYNMIRKEVPPGFGHRSALTPTGKKSTASTNPQDYLQRVSLWHSAKEREIIESNFLIPMMREVIATREKEGILMPRIISTGGEACTNCDFFARCKANVVGRGQPRFVHAAT